MATSEASDPLGRVGEADGEAPVGAPAGVARGVPAAEVQPDLVHPAGREFPVGRGDNRDYA